MENFRSILSAVWKSERSVRRILAVLILVETGIHGIVSITDNGTANRDIYVESEQEVCGLLEAEKVDQVDYRVAIVNPLVRNEEMLYQLNGVSMYSSTNTEEMWNFVKVWDLKIWRIVFSMQVLQR